MKDLIALVLCLGAVLIGTGAIAKRAEPREINPQPYGGAIYVWVDPLDGCHYLITPAGGITPRLNASDRQYCGGRP